MAENVEGLIFLKVNLNNFWQNLEVSNIAKLCINYSYSIHIRPNSSSSFSFLAEI